MKMLLKLLVTCLFIVVSSVGFALNTNEMITQTVNAFMKKNNIPGMAVEIYDNGEPNAYYFGYANQEEKIPVSGKTIFEIGSISKIMTTLLFAQEVDYAKVQLNTPITDLIPDLPDTFRQVTLQSLATHTSGLPFHAQNSINSKEELMLYFQKEAPVLQPDKSWNYSNLGISMLGYALENETKREFQQLYRSRILNVLGMRAVKTPLPRRARHNLAQGYDKEGNPAASSQSNFNPGVWGIKSSAEDMQRFLSAAIGLPNTPPRILYPMRMTQSVYVKLANHFQGLGWHIYPLDKTNLKSLHASGLQIEKRPYYNGDALIDKTGATNGFRSYIAVIPNKKSGVVILANKHIENEELVKLGRDILFKMTNITHS